MGVLNPSNLQIIDNSLKDARAFLEEHHPDCKLLSIQTIILIREDGKCKLVHVSKRRH